MLSILSRILSKELVGVVKGGMGNIMMRAAQEYPKLQQVGVGIYNNLGEWVAEEIKENQMNWGRQIIVAVLLITLYFRPDHTPKDMDSNADQGFGRYERITNLAVVFLLASWIPYLSNLAPYFLSPLAHYWNVPLPTLLVIWSYSRWYTCPLFFFACYSPDAEHQAYLTRPGRFWEDPVLDWCYRQVNPTWSKQRRREYLAPVTDEMVSYWQKYLPLFPDTPDPRERRRQMLSSTSSSGSITPPMPRTPPTPKLTLEERIERMEARLTERERIPDPAVWGLMANKVGRQPRRWIKFGGDDDDDMSF